MEINIKDKKDTGNGWNFTVSVDGDDFKVEVDKSYWEKITDRSVEPEELVRESFDFLLDREPKSSILKSFNLKVISNYFGEYEEVISGRIKE